MKLFRNPEVTKATIAFAVISLLLVCGGFFISGLCALYAAVCCLVLFLFYLASTFIRYNKISKLTNEIDRVLHNGSSMLLNDFSEGELSILANDVKSLFAKLSEQNEILKQEKVNLSDSLADISHQLRTPLTSINIVLSLLQAPQISDEKRFELVTELLSLVSATDRLVTMLLKIAQIDASAIKFQNKPVRVYDCVRKALSVIEIAMDVKNQKLNFNVGDEMFNGDIDWTTEAIGNILKNCMEHTPENGTITIEAEETPIFTKIKITDTGSGIPENDLTHLFERFYKGTNSSKNSFGIGMNLALMIVKKQNGTLKAYNEEVGACFEIRFYKSVV